jgi:hypothetical protein
METGWGRGGEVKTGKVKCTRTRLVGCLAESLEGLSMANSMDEMMLRKVGGQFKATRQGAAARDRWKVAPGVGSHCIATGSCPRHRPRDPLGHPAHSSSPCSFRFRCRNLRFRFSIFLRRSFICRYDMMPDRHLHRQRSTAAQRKD